MVTSSSSTLTIDKGTTKTQVSTAPVLLKNPYQVQEQEYLFVFLISLKMLQGKSFDARDSAQELTQKAFYKYCRLVRRTTIIYPRAYLRKILHSVLIDDARQARNELSLETDEQGELVVGSIVNGSRDEDPAEIVYQKQVINDWLEKVIPDILTLPAGQLHALICHLKEKIDDLQGLTMAFKRHGVDIEGMQWPTDKKALQSARSLLCLAQKKMRLMKPSYTHLL